jgi:hypothetical protein
MSDTPTLEHEGYEMKVRATGRTKEDAWGNLLTVLCEACSGKNERCEGEWPDYIDMNEGRIDCVPITEASNIELQLAEVTKQRDALEEALRKYLEVTEPGIGMKEMSKIGGRLLFFQKLRECQKIAANALAATKGGGQ